MIIPDTRFALARVPIDHIIITEFQPRYPDRLMHYYRLLRDPQNANNYPGFVHLKVCEPVGSGLYNIIDGHHRYLASVLAGRDHVLALILAEPPQIGYDKFPGVEVLDVTQSPAAPLTIPHTHTSQSQRSSPMKSRPTSSTLPYLKYWRHYRMLQTQQLAKLVGLANSTISGLERRDKTATRATIERLAEALSITPDQLINERPRGMKPSEDNEREVVAMTELTEGRIVHYVAYNHRHLAAIVTGHSGSVTRLTNDRIDLVVFTNMDNVNGEANGGVQFHFNVPYSETPQPGHWHWVERV